MGGRLICQSKCIVHACDIVFGWDKGDTKLSRTSIGGEWRYGQAQLATKPTLGIVLGQCMDTIWIKMVPASDGASSRRFSGEDGLSLWAQLGQRFLVTMVWLILRDDDDVWLIDLTEMCDGTGGFELGFGEPWCGDYGGT